jgi:dipeptidyl-peptidase-4
MKLFLVLLITATIYSQPITRSGNSDQPDSLQSKKLLTVEDIYTNPDLTSNNLIEPKWFDEGNKISWLDFDPDNKSYSIFQYDIRSGKESVLVSGSDLKLKNDDLPVIRNYDWSPDGKLVLLTGLLHARKVKSGGPLIVYNMEQKKIICDIESEQLQENAQFSPDSKKLGFVRGNNIYCVDIETGKETKLTTDGSNEILNGVFDWVYEEEFSIIKGWEWSPDSKKIAYWSLDQSNVPLIKIAKWDSLYFNFLDMHYPKPGAENSIVKIGVVDIANQKTSWMDIGDNKDIYIPRIRFTENPEVLSIQRMNRLQNKLELLFADVNSGKSKTVVTIKEDHWIDEPDNPVFLKDGKRFIWSSENDGWKHYYLYDINGNILNQITPGDFEVKEIISINEKEEVMYYTSNERGVIYSDLYKVKFDGTGKERVTSLKGAHTISMADGGEYFLDTYSNANTLSTTFVSDLSGKPVKDLAVSDMTELNKYETGELKFLQFTTSDGVVLNASILNPVNFDSTKKYPVLIYNYSGPGSQSVLDKWGGSNYLFHQMLAEKGYIVFVLDNRGTGGRGREFKHIVYKNLGKWEVNDMIEGAKYLSSLPYVDPARIGIWGWSYGGYMAALTILKGAAFFKAAVAVAPVTNWKYYDDIYTERYMQTPEQNPDGYIESSTITYADSLRGKLLIVHGTGDDNVNFQNSIQLTKQLISKNKQFEEMFYPEKDHGIYGGMTRIHLFNLITKFIVDNL